MVNPQVENGYVRIANEIIDRLVGLNIPGLELRAILFVLRKTYGYNQKDDSISYSQVAKALKTKRSRAYLTVKSLISRNILGVYQEVDSLTNRLYFKKDYSKWKVKKVSTNRETVSQAVDRGVSTNRETTKDNKDIIQQVVDIKQQVFKDNNILNSRLLMSFSQFENDLCRHWNEFCHAHPSISRIIKVNRERRDKLKTRFQNKHFREHYKEAIQTIGQSPFLLGDNQRKWKVSFDWFIHNDNNYVKILEGRYTDSKYVSHGIRDLLDSLEGEGDAKKNRNINQ